MSPRETRSDGSDVSRLAFEHSANYQLIYRSRQMLLAVLLACTYTLVFFLQNSACMRRLHPPSCLPRTHHMPPPPSHRRLPARHPPRPRRVPPPPQRSRAQRPTPSQNGQEDPPHATTTLPPPPPQSPPSTPPRKVGYLHPPPPPPPPSKSNGSPKTVRDDGGSTVGLRFLGSGGSLWSGGQICITCQKRKNRRRECRFICVKTPHRGRIPPKQSASALGHC